MTRYEFFRKRIAPVLFLGMVGLIAYDSCRKQQRTHSTIVIDLGDAEARVKAIEADLVVDNEVIGHFSRAAMPDMRIGCPCKFEASMPKDSGEVRLDLDLGTEHRKLTKRISGVEGAKVTLSLAADLR